MPDEINPGKHEPEPSHEPKPETPSPVPWHDPGPDVRKVNSPPNAPPQGIPVENPEKS